MEDVLAATIWAEVSVFVFGCLCGLQFRTRGALLDPVILVDFGYHGIAIEVSKEPHYGALARDEALNAFCRVVFAPIEQIDYLMRPQYWNKHSDLPDPQAGQDIIGEWSQVTRDSE